ncbi:MAG TPA: SMI1/KNR4 family protein [Polyangiaceae bacterium]|jgi:cell wall assembly regulator SMI1
MTFAFHLKAMARLYADVGRRFELAKPASDAKLRALEAKLGRGVPAALRAAWRKCDGTACPLFARPGFLTAYALLSVRDAGLARAAMRKRAPQYESDATARDRRVRPSWFEPGWLPFAGFGGGSLLLLVDLSPSARGKNGQIIAFTHDPDEIAWVAPSFEALLGLSKRAFEKDRDELLLT